MRALCFNPGEPVDVCEVSNDISALQSIVGGYIEAVPLDDSVVALCDEEGVLKQRTPSCVLFSEKANSRISFVGTVLVVGTSCGDFTDVPQHYIDTYINT